MFKRYTKTKKKGVKKEVRVRANSSQDRSKLSKLQKSFNENTLDGNTLFSPIVTIKVGREGRVFAAHEDMLSLSPFFAVVLKGSEFITAVKKISLLDEEPEIFSCVLEYLYKGDYSPRLIKNKDDGSWSLENAAESSISWTTPSSKNFGVSCYVSSVREYLLRDTVIYCAAEKYGLEKLKTLALKKQGLRSKIEVATILRSAQFAYENTVATDTKLRSHYLSLIIRCRETFCKSGTMQTEMEKSGRIFFDLFVALCNQIDQSTTKRSSSNLKAR